MPFKDRVEAGKKLAKALKQYSSQNAVLYALPRGGVVIASEISKKLKIPIDLIIIRKIGHPANPEYAVCAATEDGHVLCDEATMKSLGEDWLDMQLQIERQEIIRRHKTYLGDRKPISAIGKIAIIVDDGIATGMTMMAAIHEISHQNPKKIVVAIPIAPKEIIKELKTQVDEVIVLETPDNFLRSVGSYYDNFPQVSDGEVINLLEKASFQGI